ncbi:hypothetical protein [Dactylosporangium sp. CA-233914]|uniref:hypothetical protein n=1 Tax=Dactylosporangium sp. CA-233914 TaxID=3239934 RepID=UPI003D89DB5E
MGGSGILFSPMGGDLGGAGLQVQAGQTLGMARLQASTAGRRELGTDCTAVGHTTVVLGQHRVKPATPFRLGGCGQHLGHEQNLEQGYDKIR